MTLIANNSHYSLVEVVIEGEGNRAHTVEKQLPIIGWDVEDGRAVPITFTPRRPEALYLVHDSAAKSWISLDGVTYRLWKDAVYDYWSAHERRERENSSLERSDGPPAGSDPKSPRAEGMVPGRLHGLAGGYVVPGLDEAPQGWKPTRR